MSDIEARQFLSLMVNAPFLMPKADVWEGGIAFPVSIFFGVGVALDIQLGPVVKSICGGVVVLVALDPSECTLDWKGLNASPDVQ